MLVFGAGCSGGNESERAHTNQMKTEDSTSNHQAHSGMAMAAGDATDESIYNVTSTWKDRNGEDVSLGEFRGEVQIVAMLYTHCEFACPRIMADMKRIRDRLSQEELKNSNFVIVSIDPERDTPERLFNFAVENELSEEQWTLLNGDQGDILELAALLGFKYKRVGNSDYTHSNMISVLNKEGEIVYQRKKLGDNPTDIIAAIKKVAI